jgi:hypothetical protein
MTPGCGPCGRTCVGCSTGQMVRDAGPSLVSIKAKPEWKPKPLRPPLKPKGWGKS